VGYAPWGRVSLLDTGPDTVKCPRCGAENPARGKLCSRCFGLLHGPKCPHCGKRATRAGARFCEYCGEDLYVKPTTSPPAPAQVSAAPVPLADEVLARLVPPADEVLARPAPPADEVLAGPAPLADEAPAGSTAFADEASAERARAADAPPEPPDVAPAEPLGAPSAPQPAPSQPAWRPRAPRERVPEARSESGPGTVQPKEAPSADVGREGPPRVAPRPDAAASPSAPSGPARKIATRATRKRRRGGPRMAAVVVVVLALGVVAGLTLWRSSEGRSDASDAQPQATPSVSGMPAPASPSGPEAAESPPAPPRAGIVSITTAPAGADVELDGTPVGLTALTLSDVRPGKHTVKVSRAGYRTVSREFEVTEGETLTLDIHLSAAQRAPAPPRRGPAAPPLPPPPPPSP
jgi:hypothetical protein